uniref:Uncharacterized protein n=1 Tax=Anguilla anguilla TaxID=7936 RepID=A0A0E9WDH3_ANGAN
MFKLPENYALRSLNSISVPYVYNILLSCILTHSRAMNICAFF